MMLRALFVSVAVVAASAMGQPPEIIWYKFDSADATNSAVGGTVGNGTPGSAVSFGAGAFCQPSTTAAISSAQSVDCEILTGWNMDLGTSDWSVGMHLDLTVGGGQPNFFQYFFGEGTTDFRCFVDGVFGDGNIGLRGPFNDVIITGGGSQAAPVHVVWVYDSSGPVIRGYLNGNLASTVSQSGLNLTGSEFTVLNRPSNSSSMAPGVIMDDFRFYRRAITQQEVMEWALCGNDYQRNQPHASSDHGGLQSNGFSPATVTKCPGENITFNVGGQPGFPYDVAITLGPLVPRGHPAASELSDGQVFNVDRFNPTLVFLGSGGPVPNLHPLVPFSLPFPAPATPVTWCGQMVVVDFTQPSLLSLSQGNQVDVVESAPSSLSLGDDSFLRIGLCGGGVPFYGTIYTEAFVSSNGRVSMIAGDTDFSPTLAELSEDDPFVGFWTDLRPELTSTVQVTPGPSATTIDYIDVPYYSESATPNTFTIVLATNGVISIEGLHGIQPNPLSNTSFSSGDDQILGITNGHLGTGVTNAPFPLGAPLSGVAGRALVDFWDGTAASAPGGVNLVQSIQDNQNGGGIGVLSFTPINGGYTALSQ